MVTCEGCEARQATLLAWATSHAAILAGALAVLLILSIVR